MTGSVDGYAAKVQDSEVPLPYYFVRREDGLYVDLKKLVGENFNWLVEGVFSADTCFLGLDYATFCHLLYDLDPLRVGSGESGSSRYVRIATDLVSFPPQRRALYKTVKIDDGEADYFFEPVYLESAEDDGANEDSERLLKPASLSFDEFVAAMWAKGVRYGIDVAAVGAAIESNRSERIVVARRLEPVIGSDAYAQEVSEAIHRDNAPRKLNNGRVDFSQFENRFPQIKADVHLIKKIPRVMGVPGREISGEPIEPPVPADFELSDLAGPGTAVVRIAEDEFIVSKRDGFLSLDRASQQLSIMDKIINREGVSIRTTGNLHLSGADYEEHGEIQERRQVEGYNITIHADVFGNVSSLGGKILLKRNLVGGSAINQAGDIIVEGVASGAILHAMNGAVILKRAENCVIIGTRVEIQSASNCDILADKVSVNDAEGCAIVAKTIRVEKAAPRKQNEMLVFVRTPDLASFEARTSALKLEMSEIEAACKLKNAQIEQARSQSDIRSYLMILGKLKRNEITLSPEQKINFNKLGAGVAPVLKAISLAQAELGELDANKRAVEAKIREVAANKERAMSDVRCTIGTVEGETLVRESKYDPENDPFAALSFKDLRGKLRGAPETREEVFSGHDGSLDWSYSRLDMAD